VIIGRGHEHDARLQRHFVLGLDHRERSVLLEQIDETRILRHAAVLDDDESGGQIAWQLTDD
jgi:hypothetical protein